MNKRIPKLAHNILLSVAATDELVNLCKAVGMSKSGFLESLVMSSAVEDYAAAMREDPGALVKRAYKRYEKPGPLDGFDAFWSAYPRKTAKKAAEIAYRKLSPAQRLEALSMLGPYAESKKDSEITFIPHAATWLNQQRWQDPIEDPMKLVPTMISPKVKAQADKDAEAQAAVYRELEADRRARHDAGLE